MNALIAGLVDWAVDARGRRRQMVRRAAARACVALLFLSLGASRADAQEIIEYYATDALGSIRAVLDAAGNVQARSDYLPFGEEWQPVDPGDLPSQRFTGQQRDAEEGLDYFVARSYQTRTGRFTTIDPLGGSAGNPQSWNRYSYVANNPLGAVDPTGMQMQNPNESNSFCSAEFSFQRCGGWDEFWGGGGSPFGFGGDYARALDDGWFPGMPSFMWEGLQDWNNRVEEAFREARETVASVTTMETFHGVLDTAGLIPGAGEAADLVNGVTYLTIDGDIPNGLLSLGAMWPAGGQAITAAKMAGNAGEAAAKIAKNTERIPSASGKASYRVPDILDHAAKKIGDVKNVVYQHFSTQLRDYVNWAQSKGYSTVIVMPKGSDVSKPLQAEIDAGRVVRLPLDVP